MNQLSCQSCGSPLQVDGFDRRLAVVHCSHCGVLFDLTKPRPAHDTESLTPLAESSTMKSAPDPDLEPAGVVDSRPVAAMPPGFSIIENGKLTVRWRWRSTSNVFLLGFSVVWSVMLLLQLGSTGLNLFRSIFVLIGLGLLYRGVAGIINATTITVDENRMTVRHSPMPWYPAPTIEASSIEQLFVSEGYTKAKNGTRTPYYLLNAVLRDNSLKQLSTKFEDVGQALYLEQEFERVLHIRDRSVAGEVRGSTQNL